MDQSNAQGEVDNQSPQPITPEANVPSVSEPQVDQNIVPSVEAVTLSSEPQETKPSNIKKFVLIALTALLVLGLISAGVFWYLNVFSNKKTSITRVYNRNKTGNHIWIC